MTKEEKATSANDRQVGDEHYKTGGVEYWDLFGPEALMFYAGRYVARWRKKNGVEDLQKAKHTVEKLREVATLVDWSNLGIRATPSEFNAWMSSAGLNWVEQEVIYNILYWSCSADLDRAIGGIEYLIGTATPGSALPVTGGTDSLKFALPSSRRVPRYEAVSPPYTMTFDELTADDGCVKEPTLVLSPWQIDRATWKKWGEGSAVNHDKMRSFYKQVAPNIFRLEPWVEESNLFNAPSEIDGLYQHHTRAERLGYWLLRISEVPPDLRPCYPSLPTKHNAVEHDLLPEWQRALYAWVGTEDHGQWRLRDEYLAWHVEEEDEL